MRSSPIALLASLAAPVFAQTGTVNTTQEFRIRTSLKHPQSDKTTFDGLYVSAYHTGAGFNDAVLESAGPSSASLAFLNGTITGSDGATYSALGFDLGTDYPWAAFPGVDVDFYAAWQPVTINAGNAVVSDYSAFFINETGLQWTSSKGNVAEEEFGGCLVCNWWHLTPQLFFRIHFYLTYGDVPDSCADVYLVPKYVSARDVGTRETRAPDRYQHFRDVVV